MRSTKALTADEHRQGAKHLLAAAKAETDLKRKAVLWNRAQMALFLAEKAETGGGNKTLGASSGKPLH